MRWEVEYLQWQGDGLIRFTGELWAYSFDEVKDWIRVFGIWPVLGVRQK